MAVDWGDCCEAVVPKPAPTPFSPSSSCPHEGITKRTSNPASLPFRLEENASLTIKTSILLDTVTPRLKSVTIGNGGRLVFDPRVALAKLVTHYIIIEDGGSLEIGSESCPFEGEKAEILLIGKKGAHSPLGEGGKEGEKAIIVRRNGKLEVHGKRKTPWTNIDGTVDKKVAGLTYSITLAEPVNWEAGDIIVIASTDFDYNQAETIEVVSCSGKECRVTGELKYQHFGEVDSGVDMRAEIGLLTRNVKIHAELEEKCYNEKQNCDLTEDKRDLFGGHIMVLEGFGSFRVENAEVTKMGQQGEMARYPLHWHMAGEIEPGTTSYVRNNSIHHNNQVSFN